MKSTWYKLAQQNHESLSEGEPIHTPTPESTEEELDGFNEPWKPVSSSFITHVEYYENLEFLDIRMKSGKEYTYIGVPKGVFEDFMKAKSKGEYFNRIIKKRYRRKKK